MSRLQSCEPFRFRRFIIRPRMAFCPVKPDELLDQAQLLVRSNLPHDSDRRCAARQTQACSHLSLFSARSPSSFSIRSSEFDCRYSCQLDRTVRIASRPSGRASSNAATAKTTAVNTRDRLGSSEEPFGPAAPPDRKLPAGSLIHFQPLESTEREKSIIPPNDHFTVSNALLVSSISAVTPAPTRDSRPANDAQPIPAPSAQNAPSSNFPVRTCSCFVLRCRGFPEALFQRRPNLFPSPFPRIPHSR